MKAIYAYKAAKYDYKELFQEINGAPIDAKLLTIGDSGDNYIELTFSKSLSLNELELLEYIIKAHNEKHTPQSQRQEKYVSPFTGAYMNESDRLQNLADRIGKVAKNRGWDKSWGSGGCYIHLEVSEFIEALRGKGDTTSAEEAGDVLVSLFAVLDHYKIPLKKVIDAAETAIYTLEQDPSFGKQGNK